jgi:small subunit ribosomal protein S16
MNPFLSFLHPVTIALCFLRAYLVEYLGMLMIRLQRTGRRNDPSFRIVVGEKTFSPKSGKHLAYLGSYNPKTKATTLNQEAIKSWMQKGAQLSGTVNNLLINQKVIEGKKVNVLPKKTVAKPAEEAKPEAPAAAAEPVAEVAEAAVEEAPAAEVAGETPAEEVKAE